MVAGRLVVLRHQGPAQNRSALARLSLGVSRFLSEFEPRSTQFPLKPNNPAVRQVPRSSK